MHVGAKKIAAAGVLAAFSVLLIILSAVIETNSLFLIAASSFCVGIAVREWGIRSGACFLAACTMLNFLLAPNKIYCITFTAMGIYLLMSEFLWERIADTKEIKKRALLLWCGKYIVFNCIYVPVIVFFPSLIFTKKFTDNVFLVIFIVGQIGLFIFDRAYVYFQGYVWGKFRQKLIR